MQCEAQANMIEKVGIALAKSSSDTEKKVELAGKQHSLGISIPKKIQYNASTHIARRREILRNFLRELKGYVTQRSTKYGPTLMQKLAVELKRHLRAYFLIKGKDAAAKRARANYCPDPISFQETLTPGERDTYVSACTDCEKLFSDAAGTYAHDRQELDNLPHIQLLHLLFFEGVELSPQDLDETMSIRKTFAETTPFLQTAASTRHGFVLLIKRWPRSEKTNL